MQRIQVERCVGELRAGRPVRIHNGNDAYAVFACETVLSDHAQLAALRAQEAGVESAWQLVLPLERLKYLGVPSSGAGTCTFSDFDDDMAKTLVLAQSVPNPPKFAPAQVIESAALDLAKHAQLLPAVFVASVSNHDAFDWTLDVTLDAVRNHHHEIAASLELVASTPVPLLDDADARFVVFRGSDGLKDQVAIVVGNPDPSSAVPIRLHSACLTGDLFGSLKCDCGEQLRRAVRSFAESGGGILLYLDQEGRGIGLSNKMRAYALQADGYDTVDADAVLGYGPDERRYEIAAQMVASLGYRCVSLLTNNPRKIAALVAQGIDVADRIALVGTVNPHNERYLKAKVERSGHMSECVAEPAE